VKELKRLRLELVRHDSDLVLVGEIEEGGRYLQAEIHRSESERWTAEQWIDLYDRLERQWRRRWES
jgi:hypothetical protein